MAIVFNGGEDPLVDNNEGLIVASVLLDEPKWDIEAFVKEASSKWGLIEDSRPQKDQVIMLDGLVRVLIAFAPTKLPNDLASVTAELSDWPDAHKAADKHVANITVMTHAPSQDYITQACSLTKAMAALCKQKHVLGVFSPLAAVRKEDYMREAEGVMHGVLPISNWMFFTEVECPDATYFCSNGMGVFGFEEIECREPEGEYDLESLMGSLYYLTQKILTENLRPDPMQFLDYTVDEGKAKIFRAKGHYYNKHMTYQINITLEDDDCDDEGEE